MLEIKVPVSIIIPIYGVERYIERCVRSLFEQSLYGIEYIFVNDCTKDNSMAILNSLIKEYNQRLKDENKSFVIINLPENGGLPQARWHGIQKAKGEYIAHCDSDDWVDKEMYELLYKKAQSDNSDMVVCDFYYSTADNNLQCNAFIPNLTKEELYANIFKQRIPWFVWNKMIRTELYRSNEINVPQKTQGEDMAFILQLLYYVKRISYVGKPLYHYALNTVTPTHSTDAQSILKRYDAIVDNVKRIEKFYDTVEAGVSINQGIDYLKLIARWHLTPLRLDKSYDETWNNTFPEIDSRIYKNPLIKWTHKLRYFCLEHKLFVVFFNNIR